MREAVRRDFAQVVSTFLSHGPTALFNWALEALQYKSKDVLAALLQHGWNINKPRAETTQPLLGYQSDLLPGYAVKDEEMTLWLLDNGADPNAQSYVDVTTLSWAVEEAPISTIKLLLARATTPGLARPSEKA
ncbi:uncharacterized protein BJX67DRAFT_378782 [Aspergillus lucknowensis]|uniref:Ankyrin repeat-containing domain protein n=1 Tax=Aspergillus lucknowensis TaxID=176173 RepID=A0ABR4M299_9EURO